TASPYHPEGSVGQVPGWRLWLSKACSRLYRLIMRNKLHTYTSCFRVYRKSALESLPEVQPGFAGITEMLVHLDRQGLRILECPAHLDLRLEGASKLRVLPTMLCHLKIVSREIIMRLNP